MDVRQAHTLQQHALASLAELRSWLGSREAELAPVAAEAQRAAYASWGVQVEAATRALSKAFAECERRSSPPPAPAEPEVDSVPPTLPSHGAGRPNGLLPLPEAPVGSRHPPSSSP